MCVQGHLLDRGTCSIFLLSACARDYIPLMPLVAEHGIPARFARGVQSDRSCHLKCALITFKSCLSMSSISVINRSAARWLEHCGCCVLLVASPLAQGCLRSNDTVLQPDTDTAANSVEAAPSSGGAGGKSASSGAGGAGATSSRTETGIRAGASGGAATTRNTGNTQNAGGGGGSDSQSQTNSDSNAAGSIASVSAGTGGVQSSEMPQAGSGGEPNSAAAAGSAGSDEPATSDAAQDPDCDLTGIWIARQITVNEAIGVQAFSNNWYYLEYKQSGTTAEVTKHSDCGMEIVGAVTVTLSRAAVEAQSTRNQQVGRKLSMAKDGSSCRLESKRFWSIRGAEELPYLPDGVRDSEASIRELATMLPLPTKDNTAGAIDPDGDGKLGLAFEISGLLSGTRNSVQRDWTRWFTEPGYEFPAGVDWPDDIVIRADFDNEESVLDPAEGLLTSGSTPAREAKHATTLRFLGRDSSDPRAQALIKENQIDTCFAVQDALPAQEL